jgi:hypothetical protein
MGTVAEIKEAISKLSPRQYCELMAELVPRPDDEWDRQMMADAESGTLDFVDRNVETAIAEGDSVALGQRFRKSNVKFPSAGTPNFWRCYHALPADVRAAARKSFVLWKREAFHPSLHFKKIGGEKWPVRVGIHFRAVGKFVGDTMVWEWVGSHAQYDHIQP